MSEIRTEQIRADQAKLALERQQDRQLKDLREKQRGELERMIEHHNAIKSELEKNYDVTIATTKDEQDKRMADIRNANAKLLEEEKLHGEDEVERTRSRYQEQIARYRQNSEKQIEEIRRQTDNSIEQIKKSREKAKA